MFTNAYLEIKKKRPWTEKQTWTACKNGHLRNHYVSFNVHLCTDFNCCSIPAHKCTASILQGHTQHINLTHIHTFIIPDYVANFSLSVAQGAGLNTCSGSCAQAAKRENSLWERPQCEIQSQHRAEKQNHRREERKNKYREMRQWKWDPWW